LRRFDLEDIDMMEREVERLGLDSQAEYRSIYRGLLVEMMENGHTYEAVAGGLGVTLETLERWEKDHEEWLHAKKVGYGLALRYWEKVLNDTATGKADRAKANAVIFKLQNTFESLYENKSGNGSAPVTIVIDTGIISKDEKDVTESIKTTPLKTEAKRIDTVKETPQLFQQPEIIELEDL
jgi:hypothetical protein